MDKIPENKSNLIKTVMKKFEIDNYGLACLSEQDVETINGGFTPPAPAGSVLLKWLMDLFTPEPTPEVPDLYPTYIPFPVPKNERIAPA